jgi:hypothetical protein
MAMKTKLLIIVLVGGMLMLMPGRVFAGSHHGGHGGGGHHGGGHDGHHGGGHSDWIFSLGLGCFGSGLYDYPSYYPYYSSYYSPRVVYIDPPPPPVAERPAALQQYDPQVQAYKSELVKKREKELLVRLQQGDDASRTQTIDLLAGFSFDDQVRDALENVLKSDPNAATRKAVAETFGRVKNQKALVVLETVRVEDPDLEVRQAADRAINRIKS